MATASQSPTHEPSPRRTAVKAPSQSGEYLTLAATSHRKLDGCTCCTRGHSMLSHAVVLATRLALESGNQLSAKAVMRLRKTLDSLAALGVREVAVVDGRHAAELSERLSLHELPTLNVRVLSNLSWK